jgi:dGTPase
MAPYGGFEHNAHALRIVTKLERRYAGWDGLNLCYETLEGLVKHNGPLIGAKAKRHVPFEIREFDAIFPLHLELYASAEAQCAALADDIAYNAHDIDDGLRAGLFGLDDLREASFPRLLLDEIAILHPALERVRVIHELVRRLITRFVEDAFTETAKRLSELQPRSIDDIRGAGGAVVGFSPAMAAAQRDLKEFLFARMYRHAAILPVWRNAGRIVRGLFETYLAEPRKLPGEWAEAAQNLDERTLARLIADYIAGMTDRYALAQAEKWLGAPTCLGDAALRAH